MSTANKPKILFIDDETFFAQGYLDALDERYTVTLSGAVLDAELELTAEAHTYDLAVLDVMMPVPDEWTGVDRIDANDGESTGVVVLRRCKDAIVAANLPVVVLTNRDTPAIKTEVHALGFPPGLIEVRHKPVTPAFRLVAIVRALITKIKGDAT
jgi:CheY-like chemotaxis protein